MDLLKDYFDKPAKREAVQEVVSIKFLSARSAKRADLLVIQTDKGTMFAFTSTFPNGKVPVGACDAQVTLEKRGDSCYVTSFVPNLESMSLRTAVLTHGSPVVLA